MKVNSSSIIVLVLVVIVLFVVFRGCRQVEVHQKSGDGKSTIKVDIAKDRRADY